MWISIEFDAYQALSDGLNKNGVDDCQWAPCKLGVGKNKQMLENG